MAAEGMMPLQPGAAKRRLPERVSSSDWLGGAVSEGTAVTNSRRSQSASQHGRTKSSRRRAAGPKGAWQGQRNRQLVTELHSGPEAVQAADRGQREKGWPTDVSWCRPCWPANLHRAREGHTSAGGTARRDNGVVRQRAALSRRLTFELRRDQREDARPGPAKMYRVPPDRAWWPAVGPRL